jgi:phosphoribosylaminoimidazole-succinocarboxamide synthase
MSRCRQIYEGTDKVLLEAPRPGTLVQDFKDDDAYRENRGTITGNGALNNRIGKFLMLKPEIGIPTLLARRPNMREPLVSEDHVTAFAWASTQDLDETMQSSLRIDDFLTRLFLGTGIRLGDFGREFDQLYSDDDMRIAVADQTSPANMRLWDIRTSEGLDTDRLRADREKVAEGSQEAAHRLGILPEGGPADFKGPRMIQ